MKRINRTTSGIRDVVEATEGTWGTERLSNGIVCMRQGSFVHFSGFFDGSQEVIEIPKIQAKIPVMFVGDNFGCASVAEANAGFVRVPEAALGKKFVVLCDCVLNI